MENYQTFLHVTGPEGYIWAQEDHINPGMQPGGFPTTRWPLDKYVWDEYAVTIPGEAPEGVYTLHVGVYLLDTMERLPVFRNSGQYAGDRLTLAPFEIEANE